MSVYIVNTKYKLIEVEREIFSLFHSRFFVSHFILSLAMKSFSWERTERIKKLTGKLCEKYTSIGKRKYTAKQKMEKLPGKSVRISETVSREKIKPIKFSAT